MHYSSETDSHFFISLVTMPTYSIQTSARSADIYGAIWQKFDAKRCNAKSPAESTA